MDYASYKPKQAQPPEAAIRGLMQWMSLLLNAFVNLVVQQRQQNKDALKAKKDKTVAEVLAGLHKSPEEAMREYQALTSEIGTLVPSLHM